MLKDKSLKGHIMKQETWFAVDDYFNEKLLKKDTILDDVLNAAKIAELPPIAVSKSFGKYLAMMVQISGSKRILEIGTLGGYSAIMMARALPDDGQLITLEHEPACANVAKENFAKAGLLNKIDLRLGEANDTLDKMIEAGEAPFDFVFIDADKQNNSNYFNRAMKMANIGTIIITDNVVRDGEVIDADTEDEMVIGVRNFTDLIAKDSRVTSTALQTVGDKGYDGYMLTLVNSL